MVDERGGEGARANGDDAGARGYVNDVRVDFSLAEFTLDFLQVFGRGAETGAFGHGHEGLQFLQIEIDACHALIHP